MEGGPFNCSIFESAVNFKLLESDSELVIQQEMNIAGETHTLKIDKADFSMKHLINNQEGLVTYSSKLLSIDSEVEDHCDSKKYAKHPAELVKESSFHGVTEEIKNQAISFDICIENKSFIFGLAERCEASICLESSADGEPYRMWTSDHYSNDYPRSSMYGVVPII